MKNKFKVTALIATVLILATTVVNGQNRRPQNRMSYQGQCLDIPGLSDDQKTKITSINDAHQVKIDGMRESFYEEVDITKANEIKANMILEQNNHLKEILKVLDADQTKYFNDNIINGNNSRGRSFARSGAEARVLDRQTGLVEVAGLLLEHLAEDAVVMVDGSIYKNRKIRVYDTHTSGSTQYLILSNIRLS